MISSFVRALVSAFKARRELALENVALRQQRAVVIRKKKIAYRWIDFLRSTTAHLVL